MRAVQVKDGLLCVQLQLGTTLEEAIVVPVVPDELVLPVGPHGQGDGQVAAVVDVPSAALVVHVEGGCHGAAVPQSGLQLGVEDLAVVRVLGADGHPLVTGVRGAQGHSALKGVVGHVPAAGQAQLSELLSPVEAVLGLVGVAADAVVVQVLGGPETLEGRAGLNGDDGVLPAVPLGDGQVGVDLLVAFPGHLSLGADLTLGRHMVNGRAHLARILKGGQEDNFTLQVTLWVVPPFLVVLSRDGQIHVSENRRFYLISTLYYM